MRAPLTLCTASSKRPSSSGRQRAGSLCRFDELLRLWGNVTSDADNLRMSLEQLHTSFQSMATYEEAASKSTTLGTAHRRIAQQLAGYEGHVARTSSWAAAAFSVHVSAAEQAALPLAYGESSLRGAYKACDELGALWAALVRLQREVQQRRDAHAALAPRVCTHAFVPRPAEHKPVLAALMG